MIARAGPNGLMLACELGLVGIRPVVLDSMPRPSERRPAAERVIMHSRAQLALLRPGPEATALRQLFSELITDPDNIEHLSDLLSGAENRYGTDTDAHPLVGYRVPDFAVTETSGTHRIAESPEMDVHYWPT